MAALWEPSFLWILPIICTVISIMSVCLCARVVSFFFSSRQAVKPTQSVSSDSPSSTSRKSAGRAAQSEKSRRVLSKKTLFSSFCFAFTLLMVSFRLWLSVSALNDSPISMMAALALPAYLVGRITLSLIFIGRLNTTFKGTMLAYEDATFSKLYAFWICIVVCAVACSVSHMVCVKGYCGRDRALAILLLALFIGMDLALSCVILSMFLKRLAVALLVEDEATDCTLRRIMTKLTLLYSVCFVSKLVVTIVLILIPVLAWEYKSLHSGLYKVMMMQISWFVMACDAFVSLVSLWLKLRTATKVYTFLCQRVHFAFQSCVPSCVCLQKEHQEDVAVKRMQLDAHKTSQSFPSCETQCESPPAHDTLKIVLEGNVAIIE